MICHRRCVVLGLPECSENAKTVTQIQYWKSKRNLLLLFLRDFFRARIYFILFVNFLTETGTLLTLSYQPTSSDHAPPILQSLIGILEQRLPSEVANFEKLFNPCYQSQANILPSLVSLDAQQLESHLLTVPLYNIAQSIRTYLRELPEPLIPTEQYHDFIHVGNLQIDSDARLMMNKLINNSLSIHHSKTVQFFGLHLARVTRIVQEFSRDNPGIKLDPEAILSKFYAGVILRPSFENIL
jgi:hypothetical protein